MGRSSHEKRMDYLRAVGVGGWSPAERVQARIRYWHDRLGLSYKEIGELTELSPWSVQDHYRGRRRDGRPVKKCNRRTERKILSAKPVRGGRVPVLATRRRVQGMARDGFPLALLAEHVGIATANISRLAIGRTKNTVWVSAETEAKFEKLADKLFGADPADFGVSAYASSRARNSAWRRGWASLKCWDSDTVDDPDAHPEWTGECGTEAGFQIHYREKHQFADAQFGTVRACEPCRSAHKLYEAQRQAVEKGEEPPLVWTPKRPGRPQKTHCNKGHELVGDNVYVRKDGRGRMCLTCNKERNRDNKSPRSVETENRD